MEIYEEGGRTFLEMIKPNNFHVHLREIEQLKTLVPYSAKQFGNVMAMPNLKQPLIHVSDAINYCNAIQVEGDMWDFRAHVALYLTGNTTEKEIKLAHQSGILAVKLYPGGATTNSDFGVSDVYSMWHVFKLMEELNMPLSIHGEDVNPDVDFFDREREFIDTLEDIVIDFPDLRIIFEHVSTIEGVQFVRNMSKNVVATITPQHLLCNRNDLLAKGIYPSRFCFPVVNHRKDQEAVIAAATSGDSKFFLGTDSAPHANIAKFCDGGFGGCFTEPYAIELYAEAFERAGALDDRFEAFASFNGSDFYGLPRNTTKLRLVRQKQRISRSAKIGDDMNATPFLASETLQWEQVGAYFTIV